MTQKYAAQGSELDPGWTPSRLNDLKLQNFDTGLIKGLSALFLKGQGPQGIFSLVRAPYKEYAVFERARVPRRFFLGKCTL